MTDIHESMDESIARLVATLDSVPKPIERIVRSGEGGEHLVWTINDAFVIRVRADVQNNTLLHREKELWDILRSIRPDARAVPTCVEIGSLEDRKRPYGLYRKLSGVSLETSPQSANAATEDDLCELLLLLKETTVEKVRAIGVEEDAEAIDLAALRNTARTGWQRLRDNGHFKTLRETDIDQTLHLSESAETTSHEPILLHADLKGEHIFVDPETGRITGVIDWSDACIGHPSVDIHGLAISVGAAAAARIASNAGYNGDVIARGVFTARCDSVICLDAILHDGDDSPEWLLRRQLQRALEDF